jgi:hypothetical protein
MILPSGLLSYSKAIPELPAAFNEQLIQTRRNAKEVKGTTKGTGKSTATAIRSSS